MEESKAILVQAAATFLQTYFRAGLDGPLSETEAEFVVLEIAALLSGRTR